MSLRTRAPLGASLVVLSSVFYASYGVWTKLIGEYFGAFMQATLRHVITASLFISIAILTKQFVRIHWRRDAKWFVLSAISSGTIPASLYYGILHAGVGISTALMYVGIILGMFFFGWLFASERYTKDKWLSTALGLIGVWLVCAPSLGGAGMVALFLSFLGGFATGLNIVASKKMPYSAAQTAAIAWTLGMFANLPFIFIFKEPTNVFHTDIAWLYLVIFATMSVGASWCIIQGVKLVEAGAAGVLSLLEVVFGIVFGVLLFGERPNVVVLVGAVAILAAAAVPYIKDYNAKRGTLET